MQIIESNLTFKSLQALGTVKRIILHHAEASVCDIKQIHQWHLNNGWSGCGYHFLVRKDGSIYRGRPENKLGAHTQNNNTGSIGICFEGSYNREQMTQTQLRSGQELVAYLCDKYKLNKAQVYKHKDFNSTDCPGSKFPFEEIKKGAVQIKSYADRLKEECSKQGLQYKCTVKYGAKGNITRIIQEILGISVDGIFGSQTLQSVKDFQQKHGLVIDGIVGEKTWSKLLNE